MSVKYCTVTPDEENEGTPEASRDASARPFDGENVAVIALKMEIVNFINAILLFVIYIPWELKL